MAIGFIHHGSENRREDSIGIFIALNHLFCSSVQERFQFIQICQNLKMELSRASNGRIFDLFAQPFRILGIDPTATNQQIEEAFRIAQQIGRASADALTKARDALLDPSQRLFYELSYPL